MRTARAAALALPVLLPAAGCSPPPLLSLAASACTTAIQFASDHEVPLGSASGTTVLVGATSPCVETPAGRASYVVFALPAATAPYQITVRSSPRGLALLSPTATLYDAAGQPRSELDRFRPSHGTLVASTRGQPGDRFVVVRSNPAGIGRSQDIPTAANPHPLRMAAVVFIPVFIPPTPTGPSSDEVGVVLAHSGAITVSAMPFTTVP